MELKNQTYTRLDDDVSFQIVRTNPKLTTNTKLMYDGKNLFMEAYQADPLLATRPYKGQRLLRTGLFNNDIKNFLSGTGSTAYAIGQNMSDMDLGTSFDNQFETMYWCGVESLPSYTYSQEMGCIAPLYLRKKLPEYFVIFKVDKPSNTNSVTGDETYTFRYDVLKRARIIKTFDLREGTAIGDYISNYVGQKDFKYDKSIYVNFSSNEIYYYGIDRNNGTLTQKVENIKEQMLDNDYTILRTDERITCGFERNNLIFPYIINLEFLFNDDELSKDNDYKFARYFGMYCNTIDLQEVSVDGIGEHKKIFVDWSDTAYYGDKDEGKEGLKIDTSSFYYIKDKYNNLHSIHSINNSIKIYDDIDENILMGFETTTTPVPMERVEGSNCSLMILKVDKNTFREDTKITIEVRDSSESLCSIYTSSNNLEEMSYDSSRHFSSLGTIDDVAKAIAGVIKSYPPHNFSWITARSNGEYIFIESTFACSGNDGSIIFNIVCDDKVNDTYSPIVKVMDVFEGGTDIDGCLFKVRSEYASMFINEDLNKQRYIKCCKNMNNATVKSVIPYVNEYYEIDNEYNLITTDWYGPYVRVSKNNYIEILDKYFAKIGILSFFPVKDFDFDTVDSAYGDCSRMKNEIKSINDEIDSSEEIIGLNNIAYGRFFTENGDELSTEYDYYCENILPELCVSNKTVPYINKWGYQDDAKDSCENPYRLNTSKIFDTCNFSANTFVMNGDIMEYTHSMPYYVVDADKWTSSDDINEYQYVMAVNSKNIHDYSHEWSPNEFDTCLNDWKNFFLNKEEDNFDKMFGDCSIKSNETYDPLFVNKRFNKKYSRFLNGTNVIPSSTLFRGVKFEIIEYVDDREVKTSKYNDYKFSFIYVPSGMFKSKVYFIKNDTFKFIVGIVFFKISNVLPFKKINAYAGSLGFLPPYDIENSDSDSDSDSES